MKLTQWIFGIILQSCVFGTYAADQLEQLLQNDDQPESFRELLIVSAPWSEKKELVKMIYALPLADLESRIALRALQELEQYNYKCMTHNPYKDCALNIVWVGKLLNIRCIFKECPLKCAESPNRSYLLKRHKLCMLCWQSNCSDTDQPCSKHEKPGSCFICHETFQNCSILAGHFTRSHKPETIDDSQCKRIISNLKIVFGQNMPWEQYEKLIPELKL